MKRCARLPIIINVKPAMSNCSNTAHHLGFSPQKAFHSRVCNQLFFCKFLTYHHQSLFTEPLVLKLLSFINLLKGKL